VGLEIKSGFAEYQLAPNLSLPQWFVFSLPNGLWAFAYSLLITVIWGGSKSWIRFLWWATIPLLVIGFEVLQLIQTIPGTFCTQDMILGVAGLLLGILVGSGKTKSIYHENAPV